MKIIKGVSSPAAQDFINGNATMHGEKKYSSTAPIGLEPWILGKVIDRFGERSQYRSFNKAQS